jgi:hypothetical protein
VLPWLTIESESQKKRILLNAPFLPVRKKILRDGPWENREFESYKNFLPTLLTIEKERAYKNTYEYKFLAFCDQYLNGYEGHIIQFWAGF